MLWLLGLQDDYAHDGRVLVEALGGRKRDGNDQRGNDENEHSIDFVALAQVYKQLNAPVGQLGLDSLAVSTKALSSGNAGDDSQYTSLENRLSDITTRRNALAAQMIGLLEGVSFHGQKLDKHQAEQLIERGQALLGEVNHLANGH
jgi:hypothetical protein